MAKPRSQVGGPPAAASNAGPAAVAPTLAVHLPNWVGDTVNALPTIHALRGAGFRLHLFGRPWAPELLAGLGAPVTPLDRNVFRAARTLRESECRTALLMLRTVRSAASFWLAGIPTVGAAGKRRRSWMVTHHATVQPPGVHTAETHWGHGASACATWLPDCSWPQDLPPRLTLPLKDESRQEARRRLADVPRPFVAIGSQAVGQVGRRPKIWPHWPELCRRLTERGVTLVSCPAPGEEEATRGAVPGGRVFDPLPLATVVAILSEAYLVVANDSGAAHLGAASGTPTLGIFGVSSPERNRPWGNDAVGSAEGWPGCDEVFAAVQARLPR